MTVEQIIYLIENTDKPLLYINSIDENKLIDVFNNLNFDSIKKIFDKNIKNNQFDIFENAREVLINKLKEIGLKSETIGYFKAIGYTDFNNEDDNQLVSIGDANEEKNIIKSRLNSYLKKLDNLEKLDDKKIKEILNDKVLDELNDKLNRLIKSNIDKNDLSSYVSLFTAILDINKKIELTKERIKKLK